MEIDLSGILKISMSEEEWERLNNPIKSDYQKRWENNGWEFVTNHCFYSPMDHIEFMEEVWNNEEGYIEEEDRKPFVVKSPEIVSRMRWWRKHIKETYDAEQVRFARAHDTYGKRIPNKELFVGIYIKRKSH